jgi:hypothetical protein
VNHNSPNDDITSNNNSNQVNIFTIFEIIETNFLKNHELVSTSNHPPHVYGGQDGTNLPVNRSNRGGKLKKKNNFSIFN